MADPAPPSVVVAFSTFPSPEKAAEVGKTLVREGLAACVNLVGPIRSIYSWKGELCDDTETLAIVKTTRERFEEMRARLVALHPYEVAEVIALPVEAGHLPYLGWVAAQTRRT
jgi:periplasmic divalent cation tolerance protein